MCDAPTTAREADDIRLGALIDSLGFLLRLSQLNSYRDFFHQLGELDVRPGEVSVLMLIRENPGIRQGVLASSLMIKRAHMTKMVRGMEDTGLIERSVPDDDRRAMQLWLTDKGRDRVASISPAFEAHEARSGRRLTKAEERQLKRLLRKYLDLPPPPDGGAR